MATSEKIIRMSVATLLLAVVAVACRDLLPAPRVEAPPATAKISGLIGCRVELHANTAKCEPLTPNGHAADGLTLKLVPNAQWMVETIPGVYTEADSTYRLQLRVVNGGDEAMGTPDGLNVTGMKVFLPFRPMGYHGRAAGDTLSDPYGVVIPPLSSINQSVHPRNHDGVQSFTQADQPYWNYPQQVDPWDTSAWREWQFTLHPDVSVFYFSVGIFAAVPGEPQVPVDPLNGYLIPSDSVEALYAFSNLVIENSRMSGPYPRNVVQMAFKRSATRDERQAAIDAIGGRLIGGLAGVFYMVVIDDDGTAGPLWAAIDYLRGFPQVNYVGPDRVTRGVTPFYRLPATGSSWSLNRDSSSGANWAAEAIAAPWAWGCEVGTAEVPVVVIDPEFGHGQFVKSVIDQPAAAGQDGVGIMWGGEATLVSRSGNSPEAFSQYYSDLVAAFAAGPSVINLSFGAGFWMKIPGTAITFRRPPAETAYDSAVARQVVEYYSQLFQGLEESNPQVRPLYVVAAGNYAADAYFSGLPQLRMDPVLGERVLVVTASTNEFVNPLRLERRLWSDDVALVNRGSSHGPLVDLAAPGANVYIHTGTTAEPFDGTSFSAPHATAVAGLMKSFDPRLDAVTIRSLLLEGAVAGARTAGGYPHLDAFEALRAVARRPGAPLCDNRIWVKDGTVYAQRDTLSTAGEPLFPLESAYSQPEGINVLHGGKKIFPYTSPSSARRGREWRVVNGASNWEVIPFEDRPEGTSGSFFSRRQSFVGRGSRSHDGDTAIFVQRAETGPISDEEVTFTFELRNAERDLLATFSPAIQESTYFMERVCSSTFEEVDQSWEQSFLANATPDSLQQYEDWLEWRSERPCTRTGPISERKSVTSEASFSPRGHEGVAFLRTTRVSTVLQQSASCVLTEGIGLSIVVPYRARCDTYLESRWSAGTRVFRLDFATLTVVQLPWGEAEAELHSATVRETGREVALGSRIDRQAILHGWSGGMPTTTTLTSTRTCRTQYRDLVAGTIRLEPTDCWFDGGDGGFSPNREPTS